MTMMRNDDLDSLLGAAAHQRLQPSAALIDRVLADALALQPQPVPLTRAVVSAPRPGILARLAASFGGGPVIAGVFSAAVAGLTLGYLNPTTLDYVTGGLAGFDTEAVELFPTSDFLISEG
jgi:hypothetical protein